MKVLKVLRELWRRGSLLVRFVLLGSVGLSLCGVLQLFAPAWVVVIALEVGWFGLTVWALLTEADVLRRRAGRVPRPPAR